MEKSKSLSLLPLMESEVQFKQDLCIICQESTDTAVTSSDTGRRQVIEAATIRDDDVLKRIQMLDDQPFVYHSTNKCYKTYTMKKTLARIQQKRLAANIEDSSKETVSDDVPTKKMR